MRRVPLWLINTAAWLVLVGVILLVQWLTNGGLAGPP